MRTCCRQMVKLTELKRTAERLGITDGFFANAPAVDQASLKECRALMKQLNAAFRQRWGQYA